MNQVNISLQISIIGIIVIVIKLFKINLRIIEIKLREIPNKSKLIFLVKNIAWIHMICYNWRSCSKIHFGKIPFTCFF